MDFEHSPRTRELVTRLSAFQEQEIDPREQTHLRDLQARADPWVVSPLVEELKTKAKAEGLWNLFLPDPSDGAGLSTVEYAPLAEEMGRSFIASEVVQLQRARHRQHGGALHFGTDEQKERWLEPLLAGSIRSAFCMTEPDVASLRRDQHAATATVDGDEIVLNGKKWWSTGDRPPQLQGAIFMGLTDPDADRHHQHSMVLVPLDTQGVTIKRMLAGVRLIRRAGGPRRGVVRRTCACPPRDFIAGPGRGVRDRPGAPGTRAHPPLHALHRRGRGRAGARSSAAVPRAGRVRQAARRTWAATANASPTCASRSTRRACSRCTPRGRSTSSARSPRSQRSRRSRSWRQTSCSSGRRGDPAARRGRRLQRRAAHRALSPTPARCASPTAPTRSTAASSRASS